MNRYDVLIIGSGLGSLLCGYILSKEGFSVCILEKHSVPGGCLQSFRRGENSFETGIHYIGSMSPGQTLHSYWKYFGLSQNLALEQLNRDCYDLISLDGMEYPLAQGFDNFVEVLESFFPSSGGFLEQYISALKETVSAFPLYNFQLTDKHIKTTWMGTNAWDFLSKIAGQRRENRQLLEVLSGNNFLYAGRKESTPWHQVALINHSFISSAWRLRQGSDQITNHLISYITSAGGNVMTRKQVSKISSLKNKFQVETAGGEMFVAGRVIAGIHPQSAVSILDPSLVKRSFQSRIMRMENTISSFGLYLGLKPGSFPYMDHNLYYHKTRDAWAGREFKKEQWPGMYFIYTPSGARQGDHSSAVCILSYMSFDEVRRWEGTSAGKRGPDYKSFKSEYAEKLLQMVERKFPSIRSSINSMEVSTPLTWRDYTGTPDGSMYGIRKESSNYLKTLILPHTKIPGFYFTGQNLNMHGAPGVTIGAIMTCAEILGLEYLFNKIRDAI
ncbi:MAG: NAD(P)/FAD-dependent oxidoreductase [Bacteroidetes bacterium]|nr:NAD(P)/FAD-dependent oxidoreductase [Bacteroidota bacterium]